MSHDHLVGYAVATRQEWLAALPRLPEDERKRIIDLLAIAKYDEVWIPAEGEQRERLLAALEAR